MIEVRTQMSARRGGVVVEDGVFSGSYVFATLNVKQKVLPPEL
jgi:hypothetical protein